MKVTPLNINIIAINPQVKRIFWCLVWDTNNNLESSYYSLGNMEITQNFLTGPLFVISYLYDRAQVLASMGGGLSTYQQVQSDSLSKRNTEGITYMRELARLMNHTLTNVS